MFFNDYTFSVLIKLYILKNLCCCWCPENTLYTRRICTVWHGYLGSLAAQIFYHTAGDWLSNTSFCMTSLNYVVTVTIIVVSYDNCTWTSRARQMNIYFLCTSYCFQFIFSGPASVQGFLYIA